MITAEQKAELLARVKAHAAADRFRQGDYWDAHDRRGCAVGCAMVDPDTLNLDTRLLTFDYDDWHGAQEERWGIPAWLGMLEDTVFEGLPVKDARTWPVRFVAALPVDVELGNDLADRIAVGRLRDVLDHVELPSPVRKQVASAVEGVIASIERSEDRDHAARAAFRTAESLLSHPSSATEAAWSAYAAAIRNTGWSARRAAIAATPAAGVPDAFWQRESKRILAALTALGEQS